MMAVKLVVGLLVVLFLATFAAKNQQPVDISYYFGYEYHVKLWVAILVSMLAGAFLIGVGWAVSAIKSKSRNYRLSRKVARLEEELNAIKQKPLPDEPGVYPSLEETEGSGRLDRPRMKALPESPSSSESSSLP